MDHLDLIYQLLTQPYVLRNFIDMNIEFKLLMDIYEAKNFIFLSGEKIQN